MADLQQQLSEKSVLCFCCFTLLHVNDSRWLICLSFQMGLSLKMDPLKLTVTVAYLQTLYSVGLRPVLGD
jgi:hypothetical protein